MLFAGTVQIGRGRFGRWCLCIAVREGRRAGHFLPMQIPQVTVAHRVVSLDAFAAVSGTLLHSNYDARHRARPHVPRPPPPGASG